MNSLINIPLSKQRYGRLNWQLCVPNPQGTLQRILKDPESWLKGKGCPLKLGQSSTVVKAGGYVLKRYNFKDLRRLIKDLFRSSRAERTFSIAIRLKALGLPIPSPVGFTSPRKWGLPSYSYYICEEIPGGRSLKELLLMDSNPSRDAIEKTARLLAEIHKQHVSNRDMKASNIVFDKENNPYWVDFDGIRFYSNLSDERAASDLTRFYRSVSQIVSVDLELLLPFARTYCGLRKRNRIPRLN